MIVDSDIRDLKYAIVKIAAIGTYNDCPYCVKTFNKKRKVQKFCSNTCKDGYWNNKKKP